MIRQAMQKIDSDFRAPWAPMAVQSPCSQPSGRKVTANLLSPPFVRLLIRTMAACVFVGGGSVALAATSVTHYGITWKFDADYPAGDFVNGEPWVVGPVRVTEITPNPAQSTAGTNNGSMVNPVPEHDFGFDSNPVVTAKIKYDPKLNAALALPISLRPGDVLVSVQSQNTYPDYLRVLCALTVLPDPPPLGSFRPGLYGGERRVRWHADALDFSVLRRLRPVRGTPTLEAVEAMLPALPWFEWSSVWSGKHLQPTLNTATGNRQYGREIANKFGDIGLWLNLNFPVEQKRRAAIQTVQCGLDIYSYLKAGGGFYPDGGHKCGRKFPLLLAGLMLHDPDLLATAADPAIFQEDAQTFVVGEADVGRAVKPPKQTYLPQDVGLADWGVRHRFEPSQDDRSPTANYRAVVGPAMMGEWLAATLMGAQPAWNHAAAFAYMERNHALYGEGTPFAREMWKTYRTEAVPAKTR